MALLLVVVGAAVATFGGLARVRWWLSRGDKACAQPENVHSRANTKATARRICSSAVNGAIVTSGGLGVLVVTALCATGWAQYLAGGCAIVAGIGIVWILCKYIHIIEP